MSMKATTAKTNTKTCERCNGQGYIEHYGHIQHGVCYGCDGTGNPDNHKRYNTFGELLAKAPQGEDVDVTNARRYWLAAIAEAGAVTPHEIADARFPAAERMQADGLDPRGLADHGLAAEVGMR